MAAGALPTLPRAPSAAGADTCDQSRPILCVPHTRYQVEKDAALERGAAEASELRAAKNAHLERAEHKAAELAEKSTLVSEYLERVVKLTEERAVAEAKVRDAGAETAKQQARLARAEQEKELADKHKAWLESELKGKADALLMERKEAAMARADAQSAVSAAEGRAQSLETQLGAANARVDALAAAE